MVSNYFNTEYKAYREQNTESKMVSYNIRTMTVILVVFLLISSLLLLGITIPFARANSIQTNINGSDSIGNQINKTHSVSNDSNNPSNQNRSINVDHKIYSLIINLIDQRTLKAFKLTNQHLYQTNVKLIALDKPNNISIIYPTLKNNFINFHISDGKWTFEIDVMDIKTATVIYSGTGTVNLDENKNISVYLTPVGIVKGNVVDSYGENLKNASIKFDCNSYESPIPVVKTDSFGTFTSPFLPVGKCYVYAVYKDVIWKGEVNITSGSIKRITIKLKTNFTLNDISHYWFYILIFIISLIALIIAIVVLKEVRSNKSRKLKSETVIPDIEKLAKRGTSSKTNKSNEQDKTKKPNQTTSTTSVSQTDKNEASDHDTSHNKTSHDNTPYDNTSYNYTSKANENNESNNRNKVINGKESSLKSKESLTLRDESKNNSNDKNTDRNEINAEANNKINPKINNEKNGDVNKTKLGSSDDIIDTSKDSSLNASSSSSTTIVSDQLEALSPGQTEINIKYTTSKTIPSKLKIVYETLHEKDKKIIDYILEHSNKAKASRMAIKLLIPKTTLHRALNSLEERHIITVDRNSKPLIVSINKRFLE